MLYSPSRLDGLTASLPGVVMPGFKLPFSPLLRELLLSAPPSLLLKGELELRPGEGRGYNRLEINWDRPQTGCTKDQYFFI